MTARAQGAAGPGRARYTQSGLTVPYITAWSQETTQHLPALERRHGPRGSFLAYRGETPYDRTHTGTLWVRQSIARGKGHALFREVHALRQRQCMARLKCQVCGIDCVEGEVTEGERRPYGEHYTERQLWVLRSADGSPIQEGERTLSPPVCLGCVPESVRDCPHLREGYAAAWVGYAPSWGVYGVTYHAQTLEPVHVGYVSHMSEALRWTIAHMDASTLERVTPVNLADLALTR